MKEKRIKNYLLYALGEIILVVMGILIALWINNVSIQYQLSKKEQVYLKGLKTEFQISNTKLEELIRVNDSILENTGKLLKAMQIVPANLSEAELSQILFNTLAYDISFNSNNSLLTEIINSGSLKDISNPELKMKLTTWLATLEDIKNQEADQERERQSVLSIFRSEEYSLRDMLQDVGKLPKADNKKPQKSNLDLLQSIQFENSLLLFMLSVESTQMAHYLPLQEDLKEILELIEGEIEE